MNNVMSTSIGNNFCNMDEDFKYLYSYMIREDP